MKISLRDLLIEYLKYHNLPSLVDYEFDYRDGGTVKFTVADTEYIQNLKNLLESYRPTLDKEQAAILLELLKEKYSLPLEEEKEDPPIYDSIKEMENSPTYGDLQSPAAETLNAFDILPPSEMHE